MSTTFSQYRNQTPFDRIELNDDEWIVEFKDLNDDDIIEVIDEDGVIIDELKLLEKLKVKDMTRAISRYGAAKHAQYRAQGGGTRKDKGMSAFKAQVKGRAKSAANIITLGKAYKKDVDRGKSNFSRSFSGSIDNEKRAKRGWSPKDARNKKQ